VISQHPSVGKITPLGWNPREPYPSGTTPRTGGAAWSSRRPVMLSRPDTFVHHPNFIPTRPRSSTKPWPTAMIRAARVLRPKDANRSAARRGCESWGSPGSCRSRRRARSREASGHAGASRWNRREQRGRGRRSSGCGDTRQETAVYQRLRSVGRAGFEPATRGLKAPCSDQAELPPLAPKSTGCGCADSGW
jgi:hypothetical protein